MRLWFYQKFASLKQDASIAAPKRHFGWQFKQFEFEYNIVAQLSWN